MHLIGFIHDAVRHIGSVDGSIVTSLGPVADFYRDPAAALSRSGPAFALPDLELAPFVPETARIFCVGVNYRSHLDEAMALTGWKKDPLPLIFGRWASTLVLDGEPVPVPPNEDGLDWEVELAAVIGTEGWLVKADRALDHVLGYTGFNDLSARIKQRDTTQMTLGKNADRSGPIGPWLVTADEIADPFSLRIQTRVNGETVQDGNTGQLINSLQTIIAYITDTVTLLPGDVIATGTPGGVGIGMDPPRLLTPGDEVEVEVESIGTIRTPIVVRANHR